MGLFSFSCNAQEPTDTNVSKESIHQFKLTDLNGETFNMSSLKGKKVMVVNTASKCGLTYQYEILEKMYKDYESDNFIIVGFPANNFLWQEPGSNDQIQADVMKALTGGDRISTRELNSSQIEFKPCAKFFMACNKIPSMSDIDGGTIRRLKITEFVSRFVDDPKNNQQGIYEFKIDKDLKSKLDNFKSVFMSILLNYYSIYRESGLFPPTLVLEVTKKYENATVENILIDVLSSTNLNFFVDSNKIILTQNSIIYDAIPESEIVSTIVSTEIINKKTDPVFFQQFQKKTLLWFLLN